MRGMAVVAATATKPGGSYRLRVSVGRPGPFHTVAAGVSSRAVTVRIVPELRAKLVGPRIAGAPLSLVARLFPGEAGCVRVRVVRDGSESYRGSFVERARVRLGTSSPAPFSVSVDVLPARGYGYVGKSIRVTLRARRRIPRRTAACACRTSSPTGSTAQSPTAKRSSSTPSPAAPPRPRRTRRGSPCRGTS